VADSLIGPRSGAVAHLLVGGRCSPDGECVVVEQSRGDALKPEPELIDVGERRCSGSPSQSLTTSDLTTAGLGKSRGAIDLTARVSQ
jgi:hypothetical protein